MSNKKIFAFLILFTTLVVLGITFININKKNELLEINPVILSNLSAPYCIDNNKLKSNSKITKYHNNQSDFIFYGDADEIYYSVYGESERFYLVFQDGLIKILNTDNNDNIISEHVLDCLPIDMYVYKNNLFILSAEGTLYYVDFHNRKLTTIIDNLKVPDTQYTKAGVYINEIGVVCQLKGEDGWYLFDKDNTLRKVSDSENCYGFINKNALLFSNSYGLLFVMYQKNLNNNCISKIRIIIEKTGVFNGVIRPDGKYLFLYYGVNENGSYPAVYDLNSFASVKYYKYEYPPYSVQWIS